MTTRPDAAEYFGERSSHYDSRYDRLDADGHALRSRMAKVVAMLGPGPGTVLDAGMGPGRLCAELSSLGWTVSGIDASEEMVAVARERLPEAADRLRRAEIESLPWDDASFDAVTATGVLEYSEVDRALRELARVLRPGGRAVVSYPNPSAVYGIWKSRLWYPAIRLGKRLVRHPQPLLPRGAGALSPARFSTRLEAAGFTVEAVEYSSYLVIPTPLDALVPRTTARVGARLEGSGRRSARLLGTQIVYATRRVTSQPSAS